MSPSNPWGEINDAAPEPEPAAGMMPAFASPPAPRSDPPSDPSDPPSRHQLGDDEAAGSAPPLTASSGRKAPVRPTLDPAAASLWQGVGKGIVRGVGGLLNMWQATDETDEIWLPDEDEAAQMGEPLGRIIGRRAPMPGDNADPTDVADVVAIAIGAIGYGTRHAFEALKRRRDRRKPKPAQTIPADEPQPYAPYGGTP